MPVYRYVKRVRARKVRNGGLQRGTLVKAFSLAAIVVGLGMLTMSVGSVGFYEIFTAWRFRDGDLLSPVPLDEAKLMGPRTISEEPDLSKAGQWYPGADKKRDLPAKVSSYILAIPELGIDRALVRIGGEDLSKSLIHFGATALPGERGSGVIIGHSTLPQFFDQKNYLTIFSFLPQLKIGDQFLIYYDGIEYRYRIEDMKEFEPDDLSVLNQREDGSYITLITCVPPGLRTRRLAVLGRLVKGTEANGL